LFTIGCFFLVGSSDGEHMIVVTTQCFPPDIGGIEILMGEFASYLSQTQEQVTVFADRAQTRQAEEKSSYDIRRFGGIKPLRRWLKARAIKKFIDRNTDHPNWIIADSWKSLEQLETRCPTLVLAHGNELLVDQKSDRGKRIKKAFEKADLVLANSHFSAEKVASLGISNDHIRVFNPPASRQTDPDPQSLDALSLVLNHHRPILSTVARLEPRKGIDRVISSLPPLLEHYPDLLYVIGGAGPDRKRLETIAAELGVENHVRFLGRVDASTRSALLSRSDIFVMPTRREGQSVEGFGISYIDAAWFGVPSIASREGGAPDAVIDGVTGLIIDNTEVSSVSAALASLLQDDAFRLRLGTAASARARNDLCWTHQISVLKQHLNEARQLYHLRASH